MSASAVLAAVRWIKIATAAVLLLRLFVVGLAVWGMSTGRASVRDLASAGNEIFAVMLVGYSVELIVGVALFTAPDPYSLRFRRSLAILVAMLSFGLVLSAVGWLVPGTGFPQTELPGIALSGLYVYLGLHALWTLRKQMSAGGSPA